MAQFGASASVVAAVLACSLQSVPGVLLKAPAPSAPYSQALRGDPDSESRRVERAAAEFEFDGGSEEETRRISDQYKCEFAPKMGSESEWQERGSQVVYMLGDSTTRLQFDFLCQFFNSSIQPTGSTVGNTTSWCQGKGPGHAKLTFVFFGRNEASYAKPEILGRMRKESGHKADVLYFTGGLHWMHLLPYRKWAFRGPWQKVEQNMDAFLTDAFGSTKRVVYMTLHALCEERYTGDFQEVVELIAKDTDAAAAPCADWLTKNGTDMSVARSSAVEECTSAFKVRDGASRINTRALRAMEAWEQEHGEVVHRVDAWNITANKCDLSPLGDGVHFYDLVHIELLELWRVLGWIGEAPVDFLSKVGCKAS